MKRILLSLVVLFIALGTISAQSSDKFTGSLLWKISGKGLKQPSYILGTHHLAPTTFADSIVGLDKAMADAQQTVGELLMADKTDMQAKLQGAAMFTNGESYKNLLTEDEYTALDEGLKGMLGVGLDQAGMMKPGVLNMLYSITLYVKSHPEFNPTAHVAIDEYVQNTAIKDGKTALALETVEDQLYALFDAEPLGIQAKALACSVSNEEFGLKAVNLLNKYYREGKLAEVYNLAFYNSEDPCPQSETAKYAMLKERNDKWLAKLPQIMKDKPSLIAVGALHLAGEEGLLFQLDKMGYKVEIVK